MLDPDAWPAQWRERQHAADRHPAAGSIIVEEGDTDRRGETPRRSSNLRICFTTSIRT
jgi:hypothetical protein